MSISSISGLSSLDSLFKRIDADSDGKITKSEFVSARPSNVSESRANSLFDSLDKSGSGSLSESDLENGQSLGVNSFVVASPLETLSSDILAVLFMMLQGGGKMADSAEEQFKAMDTDGDGTVSKTEFLAAKPDDMSDEQAEALYDSIDSKGVGSITLAQYKQSILQGSDAPPPLPLFSASPDDSVVQSASALYSALDINQDGIVSREEFLTAKPNDMSSDMAINIFNSMDSDKSGGLSLSEYAAGEAQKSQQTADALGATDISQKLAYLQQLLLAVSTYSSSALDNAQQSPSSLTSV